MKRLALALGLLCANTLAVGAAAYAEQDEALSAAALQGSCAFEGVYASGCIEFTGTGWNETSMQGFCQAQSRPGETATVQQGVCKKADYNVLCASPKSEGMANIYVNDMPDVICKRFLKGSLTNRPDAGW